MATLEDLIGEDSDSLRPRDPFYGPRQPNAMPNAPDVGAGIPGGPMSTPSPQPANPLDAMLGRYQATEQNYSDLLTKGPEQFKPSIWRRLGGIALGTAAGLPSRHGMGRYGYESGDPREAYQIAHGFTWGPQAQKNQDFQRRAEAAKSQVDAAQREYQMGREESTDDRARQQLQLQRENIESEIASRKQGQLVQGEDGTYYHLPPDLSVATPIPVGAAATMPEYMGQPTGLPEQLQAPAAGPAAIPGAPPTPGTPAATTGPTPQAPGQFLKGPLKGTKKEGLEYDPGTGLPVTFTDKSGKAWDINDPALPPEAKKAAVTARQAHAQRVQEQVDQEGRAADRANRHAMMMSTLPTGPEKTEYDRANSVLDFTDRLKGQINAIADSLGPGSGRYNDFMTGKVGLDDPRYSAFLTNSSLEATRLMQMHTGNRPAQQMFEHFQDMVKGRQAPRNLLANLGEIEAYGNRITNQYEQKMGLAAQYGNVPAPKFPQRGGAAGQYTPQNPPPGMVFNANGPKGPGFYRQAPAAPKAPTVAPRQNAQRKQQPTGPQ